MNARNSEFRVFMLKNSNKIMNKVVRYLDIEPESTNKQKITNNKNKIIYYLLNPQGKIIGVISLYKIEFTDFQNAANNDKVYSFRIKIDNEYLSPLFISEVWNDFINNRGNFIYCFYLNLYYIKGLIEDLNKLYNIYYNINLDTVDVIFGPKVEGKKKYLKIEVGEDFKLNKSSKSENQKGHINAYLRNYPNKKSQNLSTNGNGPAIPTTKSSYSNGPAIPNTTFSNNNNINEKTPLLGKKKSGSVLTKIKNFFRRN